MTSINLSHAVPETAPTSGSGGAAAASGAAPAQTTIEQLLGSTQVSTIPLAKGKLIVIDSKTSPGDGFQQLMDNNILGAPVYDATHKQYTGFLDVRDLVDLVVHRADQGQESGSAADGKSAAVVAPPATHHLSVAAAGVAGAHHHGKSEHAVAGTAVSNACKAYLNELMLTGDVMINSKMTVSYLSRRHPFKAVAPDASLLDVAKILAGESHRVPVVDAQGKLLNIISQSSIVTFLNQHMKELHAEASKTVDQWAIGTSPVQSVRDNVRALDVFRAMSNHHMSGLAVVDASGSFLASTNSTDLKLYLNHPKLGSQLLQEPILDFLSQLRQDDLKYDTRTKVPTLSVSSNAPLSLVIGRLAATKSHKIFVADHQKQYHPSAVISLTDVLRTVLKLKKPASSGGADQPSHGKLGANKSNH